MSIAGIGYTSYMNNMYGSAYGGAYGSAYGSAGGGTNGANGIAGNTANGSSASGITNPSLIPALAQNDSPLAVSIRQNASPAAMFYSIDGDSVEFTSKLVPEMPGSGLLETLKPEGECETCANRKYMDQSDDASVSYQSPTKLGAATAGAKVAAHEQEHVRNEQAKAARDGRQVVSQSVTLQYDTCPECGRSYVSGGTTRTTTVGKKELPGPEVNTDYNAPESSSGSEE